MLDKKKQIQVIFLSKFKMGHKAAQTTCKVNNTFLPGTANIQCSGGTSFAKETGALNMRSAVACHQKLTMTNWIIKADPLTATWEVAQELNTDHSMVIQHLEQIGKVKNFNISGCLMSWSQIKKKCHFEVSSSLILCPTMNHFSIRLWHAMKSGFYMTTGDDQLSGWTKKKLQSTFQSQTCTKKRVMVTVWWSAAGLTHYSFLNSSETSTPGKDTQPIDEMHWKLQCLQPALVNRKSPILLHNNAQLHIA